MKKIFLLVSLHLGILLPALAQLNDDFSDGNFSDHPSWSGNETKYEINVSYQLQLNAPAESSNAYLSTWSEAVADAEWNFYVEVSENPSSSNYCRVYLVSDQAKLTDPLHGYFVEIGGSQDEVSLYRQDGTGDTKIIDGADDRVDMKPVEIFVRVNRDATGNWTLAVKNAMESAYTTEGVAWDDTYTESKYFGIYCDYTSTRSSAFFFDDFLVTGTPVPDTTPPAVEAARVTDAQTVYLAFSEALYFSEATAPQNYSLSGQSPSEVNYTNDTVRLSFHDPMTNGIHQDLTITSLSDLSDNAMADTTISILYFEATPPRWQSIVINEFFADPTPSLGTLPDESNAEFIELFNTDSHPYNLEAWTINGKALPSFILLPGSYVILSHPDFSDIYSDLGDVINPDTWPRLSNSGATISLTSPDNTLIDTHDYDTDDVGAGISTERIYSITPCGISENYALSTHEQGATPGLQNSVFSDIEDTSAPVLLTSSALSYDSLLLTFNEKVIKTEGWEDDFFINSTLHPDNITFYDADSTTLLLQLNTLLTANATYEIHVSNIADCENNVANVLTSSLYLDLDPPFIKDIIITDTASVKVVFSESLEKTAAERESNYQLIPLDLRPRRATLTADSSSVLLDFSTTLRVIEDHVLRVSAMIDQYGNMIPPHEPKTFTFSYQDDIDSVEVINAFQLNVYLQRAPELSSLETAGFSIDRSVGKPARVIQHPQNSRVIQLFFSSSLLENKYHELTVGSLVDTVGKRLSTPIRRFYYDTDGPEIEAIETISATELRLTMSEKFHEVPNASLTLYLNDEVIVPETYQIENQHLTLHLPSPLSQEEYFEIGISGLADQRKNHSDPDQDFRFYFDLKAPELDTAYFYTPNQIMLIFHEPIKKPILPASEVISVEEPFTQDYTIKYLQLTPDKIILSFASLETLQQAIFELINLSDLNQNMISSAIPIRLENQQTTMGHFFPISDRALEVQLTRPETNLPVSFFSLEGINPDSIQQISPDRVRLFFPDAFREGLRYQLFFKEQVMSFMYHSYVEDVTLSGPTTVHITWEKPLDFKSAEDPLNYLLNEQERPIAAQYIAEEELIQLAFSETIESNKLHTLTLSQIQDTDHMRIPDSRHYLGSTQPASLNELIITEVMADPTPAQDLPDAEYVEIYNNSNRPLQLRGIVLQDNNQSSTLSSSWLLPGRYLTLCDDSDYQEMGQRSTSLALSSFPNLNNESDQITLTSPDGNTLLHQVSYEQSWYNDEFKRKGGWSLEMVDLRYPCLERSNWTASTDPSGGTPGRSNSVTNENPDNTPPSLVNVVTESPSLIRIEFDEKLLASAISEMEFRVDNQIVSERHLLPNQRTIHLSLDKKLQSGVAYQLHVHYVADCSGNVNLDTQNFTFYLPEAHNPGDVLLSEILFHPRPGGVDFVELYNHSSKNISLKNWKLALEEPDGLTTYVISDQALVMAPHSYLAITKDTDILQADYPPSTGNSHIYRMLHFPNLLAEGEQLLLMDERDSIMQMVSFSPDWHHPLLQEERGVSLERIRWDGSENTPEVWQSSASTVGYATPGYQNSQWMQRQLHAGQLSVDPPVIYPDRSGFQDYTRIRVNAANPGAVVNLQIFDAQGNLIRQLVQNASLSSENEFIWDGTDDHQRRAKDGYYLIWSETFDTSGNIQVSKNKVVVGSRY
jgi:hypothetical protein